MHLKYQPSISEISVNQKLHRRDSHPCTGVIYWTPPPGRFGSLDYYISKCRSEVNKLNFKRHLKFMTDNLTPGERASLISLRQRTDVVIKPADKGGAVVVWDRNLYKQEAERQLSDSTFFERLDRDFTVDYNKTVCEVVKEAITKGELPASAVNLVVENLRTSRFYLLPKVYKTGNPGRPIVSACNCRTELIATYLDRITTPLVQSLLSFGYKSHTSYCRLFSLSGNFQLCFHYGCEIFVHCQPQWRWPLGIDAFSQQKTGPATTNPYSGSSCRTGPYFEHILVQWKFLSADRRGRDGEKFAT